MDCGICCAGSSHVRPSHNPILCWSIWRQFHWCLCTAPVTLLAENKKVVREVWTLGGPRTILNLHGRKLHPLDKTLGQKCKPVWKSVWNAGDETKHWCLKASFFGGAKKRTVWTSVQNFFFGRGQKNSQWGILFIWGGKCGESVELGVESVVRLHLAVTGNIFASTGFQRLRVLSGDHDCVGFLGLDGSMSSLHVKRVTRVLLSGATARECCSCTSVLLEVVDWMCCG